jgi:hypothetical protein
LLRALARLSSLSSLQMRMCSKRKLWYSSFTCGCGRLSKAITTPHSSRSWTLEG